MAYKSTKHRTEAPLHLPVDGGLNLGKSPSEIGQNELTLATNFYYAASGGILTTRPALDCVTAAALSHPITAIHSFVNATVAQVLVVSNGSLYVLDDDVLTLISALSGANNSNPCFLNFNQKCLIATGHTAIYTYDGTTLSTISGSPAASALYEMKNRVIANTVTYPDICYMSAAEDETEWTTVGGAVEIPMGYGDGYTVNAFAHISDILVVSKVRIDTGNVVGRKLFGVNMGDLPENWSASYLSQNNAAISHSCMIGFGQDIFFIDSNGFKSLRPTQQYGDITTDVMVGEKINANLVPFVDTNMRMRFLNHFGSFMIANAGYVWVLNPSRGWTDFYFPVQINDMCELGHTQYLAGENGHVYTFSESGYDETEPAVPIPDSPDFTAAVTVPLSAAIRCGQKQASGSDIVLKEIEVQFDCYAGGDLYLDTVYQQQPVQLMETTVSAGMGATLVINASMDVNDANFDLTVASMENKRGRSLFRGRYIQPQIRTENGCRLAIHWIKCLLAQVEG